MRSNLGTVVLIALIGAFFGSDFQLSLSCLIASGLQAR
jgi:hypothetical protein